MGEILEFMGNSLANFNKVSDAVQDVEYLTKKNSSEHGRSLEEHPPQMDEEKPEYSMFWFVKAKGKESSWTQTQKKELNGTANLKTVQDLKQGCRFMEGLGFSEALGSGTAQIENVKYTMLMKEIETCKSTYKLN